METCEQTPIEIFVGQDSDIPLTLTDEDGNPVKLTSGSGLTEITARFQKPQGVLELTKTAGAVTLVDAEAGRIKVRISKENAALLTAIKGKAQSFEVLVDRTVGMVPDRKVARFEKMLIVQPSLLTS